MNMTTLILFGSFVLFLVLGLPVSISLGLSSLVSFFYCGIRIVTIAQRLYTGMDSFPLMAIPLFILAGNLMTAGGISRKIVDFANILTGRVRGGLAYTAILACAIFAALSGGRYDNLTGIFGMPGLSGVGISFGADRIYDVLNALDLYPKETRTATQLLFVNFGEAEAARCMELAAMARRAGIRTEVYPDAVKMKKQMSYANVKNIPFVAIVGENEMNEGKDKRNIEIIHTSNLEESVKMAKISAKPGDIVLLSPASASFDAFKNFMERGQKFKDFVNELK